MSPETVVLILRIALALVVYGFLGLLLWALSRDLVQVARASEPLPAAHLLLAVPEGETKSYRLGVTNLIGRAADNTICLDDTTVSSYHVRLSFQGGQWWLEDLGSRNGTGVNDLAVDEPLVVTYGDRIRLGRLELNLAAGEPPARREGNV